MHPEGHTVINRSVILGRSRSHSLHLIPVAEMQMRKNHRSQMPQQFRCEKITARCEKITCVVIAVDGTAALEHLHSLCCRCSTHIATSL